jgi:hypothetical protein
LYTEHRQVSQCWTAHRPVWRKRLNPNDRAHAILKLPRNARNATEGKGLKGSRGTCGTSHEGTKMARRLFSLQE